MKMYLLDNNILSELWKHSPDKRVEAWFASKPEWFLPVPVIAEIQEGAEATGRATCRAQINAKLDEFLRLHNPLVLPFDTETARTWGRLRHSPKSSDSPRPLWGSLIDAMAV